MDRRQLVLATLFSAGPVAVFTPIQVQKIFFLIDRKAAHLVGGPHFNFQPYDYGPFDNVVYDQLAALGAEGLLKIESSGRYRQFSLTSAGYIAGSLEFFGLPVVTQAFIKQTVEWVRGLRFDQLVAAIYREYPDMKAKSIFNQ